MPRLAKLVHVVSGNGFDLDLADSELAAGIEKADLLHLHGL